ncbi:MAG: hypothetical protein J2P21_33865, partial [Chloracidobacterium sp.]|nr:hypothetical protein [Chloracidobacterium sp.]
RHVGRVTIRQRPSFRLNGFDVHPKYLTRIHKADGFEYTKMKVGARGANAEHSKALGHSTALP